MRLLLEQLAALPRCAIPPGFIFLPGPELEIPGFGFAPRTWLSARQIESPDPLSIHYGDARLLHGEGLEVMFPGFRLYQMDALATPLVMTEKEKLSFPSESNILEWYTLEEADTNVRGAPPWITATSLKTFIFLTHTLHYVCSSVLTCFSPLISPGGLLTILIIYLTVVLQNRL